jgi:phospholipid-binding lipoprotein MlaA
MLMPKISLNLKIGSAVLFVCLLSGCATVPGPRDERDPFESFNRAMYKFNNAVDKAYMQPLGKLYNTVAPDPVNQGITNFFSNLNDVTVLINNVLQFKLKQAAQTTGRVVVNSTVGILGFFDVASHMGLEKNREDFGQTLGYWGFGTGPYIVLPLLGPSDARDTVGLVGDVFTDPVMWLHDHDLRAGLIVLRAIDKRADMLEETRVLEEAALDSYIFTRDAYLQHRNSLVHDGHPPASTEEDQDDAAEPPAK